MEQNNEVKDVAVKFATFLNDDCFYNINGFMIYPDDEEELNQNEYEIDELYDYWIENIYVKTP